jgi:hypothetical protein
METKILYAYCPACDYQNTCVTDRKYRRRMKEENWRSLVWKCGSCGKEFQSDVRFITASFEDWCGFWLYQYRFSWKIPGIVFLACGLYVTLVLYFESWLPSCLQYLIVPAIVIGIGAGFLLLTDIPYAYPVYVVNDRRQR